MRHLLTALALCLFAGSVGAQGQLALESPAFVDQGRIPLSAVYTACNGGNRSPQLTWINAPASTRSFAITVFDGDAPGGFWHWIVFNVPASAHGLAAGSGALHRSAASAHEVQLVNDFGQRGYSGPCPPVGPPHHYLFTLYALDVPVLGTAPRADRAAVLAAIQRHALATAHLTGTWGR